MIDARDHSPLRLTDSRKPPTIRLHLEEFATECGWDHLYVYDGDSVESALLAVFRFVYYFIVYYFNSFLRLKSINVLLSARKKNEIMKKVNKIFIFV